MTPYYQDNLVTLYHGDCREILPTVRATVAIADPPYNLGIGYGAATDDRRRDYAQWCREWFELLRTGTEAVAVSPGIANVGLWAEIEQPTWILAWLKPAAMGRGPLGFNNWEPVIYWGRPPKRPVVDVFTAPIVPDNSLAGHPCPKPLRWGTALVTLLTDSEAVVIDPFAGTGTTLLAAKELGRRSIGIEIEERYCEIAAQRCSQEVLGLAV